MDEYFNYLDMNMDNEFVPAFPNDNIYKKTIIQKNVYPSNMQGVQNMNPQQGQQNQNTLENILNIPGNQNCGLFNDNEGFIRGNMFPNLYDPYKNERVTNVMPTNERDRQLLDIQKVAFAMKDINLYLDVHPEDRCMINLYNRYLDQKKELVERFEKRFGPITLRSNDLNNIPWAWNMNKWPWEGDR